MIYPLLRSIHKFKTCNHVRDIGCVVASTGYLMIGAPELPGRPGRCQDRSWWGANGAAFRSCSKNGRRYSRCELPKDAKTPSDSHSEVGQSPEAILPTYAEQILRINVNPELTTPLTACLIEVRVASYCSSTKNHGLVVNPLINKPGFSMV